MTYDFDTLTDRRGTDSEKWDVGESELPMWVADMDFQTAPEILQALEKRLRHGIFGYTYPSGRWREAYAGWWKERYGFAMQPDWLVFCTGVVPAISSAIRVLTTPNENVVIQTPVYNIFFNSIRNRGCRVLENPLKYENGTYFMDFGDLEMKLSDPQTTLMILCNPQNPAGKIWDPESLRRVGDLCKKHHVTVIADEIHCDLTAPGKRYIPFASVSEACREISITCIAPTKTFNIAGLQTAAVSAVNPVLRHKIWRAMNTDDVAEPNAFATTAAIAAYEKGAPWLDALRTYLWENRKTAEEYIAREIPGMRAVKGEATYLLWIDISGLTEDSVTFARFLREKTGLFISAGAAYGKGGEAFLRMNLACPRTTCLEGLKRLKTGAVLFMESEASRHCR